MSTTTATITTEDAERLVAEGGLVNLDHGQPYWCPTQRRWLKPGTSHSCLPEAKHWPRDILQMGAAGEVHVTDVHHADDCPGPRSDDYMCMACAAHVFSLGTSEPCDDDHFCHPDAKPDMWHWTVAPAE